MKSQDNNSGVKVKWLKREKKTKEADLDLISQASIEELKRQLITCDGHGKAFKTMVLDELLFRKTWESF